MPTPPSRSSRLARLRSADINPWLTMQEARVVRTGEWLISAATTFACLLAEKIQSPGRVRLAMQR